MRYICHLKESEIITLEELHKNHPTSQVRRRAHMLLLSDQGQSISSIASIYGVRRNTVARCMDRWEKEGIVGLLNKPRPGRPRLLSPEEEERAVALIEKDCRNRKHAQQTLEKETGKTVSEWTFKRSLKRVGLRWKRMRRSLKSNQDPASTEASKADIALFHANEELDVCYFDESGVSTVSDIPYGWQPAGDTVCLPAQRSKRVNILGFFTPKTQSYVYHMVEGWVTSQHVIASMDAFVTTLTKPTVIILDNASIHRSAAFQERVADWQEKGLFFYYLPPYSPELNLIEILWRFLKYPWLPLDAFQSFAHLKKALVHVLDHVGTSYSISFA